MLTRRLFVAAAPVAALSACVRPESAPVEPPKPDWPPLPAFYGALHDEPFPVPAVPEGVVDPRFWRQQVPNPYPGDAPGAIIVDPAEGLLHLVESPSTAMRYGAGTGAAAFSWNGAARVQFTRAWPTWKVPDAMVMRRPELAPYTVAKGGMPGGPGNPLGARALYLFQNGEDTLYRIHGACEPQYLGKAVSSGCIRLLDQDIIDLERRARQGASVRVLPAEMPVPLDIVY